MNEQNAVKPKSYIKSTYLPLSLIVLGAVVYSNSFAGPFIFDDIAAIKDNPNIRSLWPPTRVMSAPAGSGIVGRPVLSLSLALNYAISGYKVWSYHLVNLIIHILASLALYGIIKRTLLSDRLKYKFGDSAGVLAFAIAAIWLVHPVQTQSVTYVIQRGESLMGLFYLLTLYAAIRAMGSRKSFLWSAVSVICCGLGMATKEVMVTAPVLVLLYDRAFSGGLFSNAFRRRWRLYISLAGTWGIIFALMWFIPRSEAVGFSGRISSLEYALSQPGVILHYLRLCIWPVGLCLDYSWPAAKSWSDIVPPMVVVLVMLAVTLWGLVRNCSWSYPLIWLFGVLAPTSSFVPIIDLAFEHRMYLSLAGFAVLLVMAVYALLEGAVSNKKFRYGAGSVLVVVVILALGFLTVTRNRDYRSRESIWRSAVVAAPNNPRGHDNLGLALQAKGKIEETFNSYSKALELAPTYANAHNNLAVILELKGRFDEAIGHYQTALEIKSDYIDACHNLGLAFQSQGKFEEAIDYFNQALRIKPDYAEIYNDLGSAYKSQGKFREAIDAFHRAIQLRPDFVEAYHNLGLTLRLDGQLDRAIDYYRKALEFEPDQANAHYNLANALTKRGDTEQAIKHFEQALQTRPEFVEAHNNLAIVFKSQGKADQAITHFRQALQVNSDYVPSLNGLALILSTHPEPEQRDPNEAIGFAKRAAELTNYQNAIVLDTLAASYAAIGELNLAIKTEQEALALAQAKQNHKLANQIRRQLKLYKKAKLAKP